MKLDFNQFPAIKNLSEDVREKALEYAKTLGARGPRPTTVLGTAVTLAHEWKSGRLPAKPIVVPFLVQPKNGRWVIKRSNDELPTHVYMRKDDAVRRAQELAKESGAACFVFGPGGTLLERYEARVIAAMHFPEVVATPVEQAEKIIEVAPVVPEAVEAAPVVAEVIELAPIVQEVIEVAPIAREVIELAPIATEVVSEAIEFAPVDPSDEPIRVKRVANKWLILLGDGRTESLATKAKAVKRATELGKKLGRPVING